MAISIILIPRSRSQVELAITSPILSPNSLDPLFRLFATFKEKDSIIKRVLKRVVETHLEDIIAFNRNSQVISLVFEGISPTTPYPIDLNQVIYRLFDVGEFSMKIKAELELVKSELESLTLLLKTLIEDFEGRLRVEVSKMIKSISPVERPICPMTGKPCLLERCSFFDFEKGCLLLVYLNF
ncbi:protein of unknown function (plasmid) [Thermococcus nautili]|uniref:hypothetical protein n=1 Tax=Thermococcus nautili TaxID=195522 RepID=UPI00255530F9|nr:hypothetical protein [Thermococcus nautili]CAI1494238.1 protein of unknown function [Thermococcus nautili]